MKKIRRSVFETNSSSTHSICVAETDEYQIPKSIHFDFGEFGWEFDVLRSVGEKADYLYTGLIHNKRPKDAKSIIKFLRLKGIDVTFEPPKYVKKSYVHEGKTHEYVSCENDGWVDHGTELNEFLDTMVKNKKALLAYLFSDLSYVLTGNDNSDRDVEINVDYPHTVYYKGN
jgi:hypothetical protein